VKTGYRRQTKSCASSRHRHHVGYDVGGRQPGLNIRIPQAGTEIREAIPPEVRPEPDLGRIGMTRHSRNRGQLVSKGAVNPTAIILVVLVSKPNVIQECGTERVVPIHSQHGGAFIRGKGIADLFRKS